MDAESVSGDRVAVPAALVRVSFDMRAGDKVVGKADLWHLTDDIDVVLSAEEFHPVDSLETARRIAGDHGATKEERRWVAKKEAGDPVLEAKSGDDASQSSTACGALIRHDWAGNTRYRYYWTKPYLFDSDPERLQEQIREQGSVWAETRVDPAVLVDVSVTQEAVQGECGPFKIALWMTCYTHVPGLTKRKESARRRQALKREGSVPTARKLHELLCAMSELGEVVPDKHRVKLAVSFVAWRIKFSTRSMPALKALIPRMVEVQRALGNPWLQAHQLPASVQVIKSVLLHREPMRQSDEPFWRDLLSYLEEVEPNSKSRLQGGEE